MHGYCKLSLSNETEGEANAYVTHPYLLPTYSHTDEACEYKQITIAIGTSASYSRGTIFKSITTGVLSSDIMCNNNRLSVTHVR
jgi:hypothetical protein